MSLFFFFFCFKQKTAYEMRISDWSSDVCSSDLLSTEQAGAQASPRFPRAHGHCGRPQGDRRPPRPGPQEALGLSIAAMASGGVDRLRRRAEYLRVQAANRRVALPGLLLPAAPAVYPDNMTVAPLRTGFPDIGRAAGWYRRLRDGKIRAVTEDIKKK